MSNEQTVRDVYAAFKRGDVAAILARVADDVDWRNDGVASHECPWNANFSGKTNLPGFFQAVGQTSICPYSRLGRLPPPASTWLSSCGSREVSGRTAETWRTTRSIFGLLMIVGRLRLIGTSTTPQRNWPLGAVRRPS